MQRRRIVMHHLHDCTLVLNPRVAGRVVSGPQSIPAQKAKHVEPAKDVRSSPKKARAGSKGLPVVRSNHHYAASTACNKPVAIVIVGRAGGVGTAVDLKVKHATAVRELLGSQKRVLPRTSRGASSHWTVRPPAHKLGAEIGEKRMSIARTNERSICPHR